MSWDPLATGGAVTRYRTRRDRRRVLADRLVAALAVVAVIASVAAVALLPRLARGEDARRIIVVVCHDRAEWSATVRERWDERPLLEGLAESGGRAELFASPQRTWSFVITTPAGRSCLIAEGRALGPAINILPEEMHP